MQQILFIDENYIHMAHHAMGQHPVGLHRQVTVKVLRTDTMRVPFKAAINGVVPPCVESINDN